MSRPAESRTYLWRLRPYYRQIAGLLAIGSLCGLVMNVAVVLPALLLGHAINVVSAFEHGHASSRAVAWSALLFLAGTAATEVPRVGKRYWLGVARARFAASVRADALRGALSPSPEETNVMRVGDVMARVIGDVQVLRTGVGEVMVETWDTLLFSVSLVGAMLVLAPGLSALALAPVPLALWLAKRSGVAVARRTRLAREAESDLTAALREQLGALRLLRLFGRTHAAAQRISKAADAQAAAELSAIRLDEALAALYSSLLSSGVVFLLWLGGRDVVNHSMSLGTLVALLTLFVRFTTRAPRIPQMANRVQAGGAAFRRLEGILAAPSSTQHEARWFTFRAVGVPRFTNPAPGPAPPSNAPTALSFHHVTFTYPESNVPAVVDVHLDVAPGSLVAVTGPVGSGKSTLARLGAGLLAPGPGTVMLNGVPATALTPERRARMVGYLDQEPHLFSGSITDNITLWQSNVDPPRRVAEVGAAIALAALDHDLSFMPQGPDTPIGELGVRVSGGQRQRIALARALAAHDTPPGLLVLDDPFSGADVQTEALLVAGLRAAFGPHAPSHQRATILLCSHRLASFPLADVIVVLDGGRAVEIGTHPDLLATRGVYATIFRAQAQLEAFERDERDYS